MQSIKDNLLETLKIGGKPDRLVNQWEPFVIAYDPIMMFTSGSRERGKSVRDGWGTLIVWPEDQVSGMPHVTKDEKVIHDVTKWRESLRIPDIEANCGDKWEFAISTTKEARSNGKLAMSFMPTGVFDRLHFLMGFEDTLTNFLLEPEAMHELCDAIGDHRLVHAKMLLEKSKPDIVLHHDDWGSKRSLFMSPETWREFIKPQYVKLYSYLKESGVIIMHHADSFLEPIVEDMIELGIDIWQGALPENDLLRLQKQIAGRMVLMGGIDVSIIDRPDSTEEEIRSETRRVCEAYGSGGHFIPSHTYGSIGTLYPHVDPIISDEIKRYNMDAHGIK